MLNPIRPGDMAGAPVRRAGRRGMNVRGQAPRPVHKVVASARLPSGAEGARAGEVVAGGQQASIAADVGGTHARMGLVSFGSGLDEPSVLASRVYRCADHAGLDAVVRDFCEQFALRPPYLALACAGFLHEGRMVNSSLAWPIVPSVFQRSLALDDVCVVNDFEALAHAAAHIGKDGAMPLHAPRPDGATSGGLVVLDDGAPCGRAIHTPGLTRSSEDD